MKIAGNLTIENWKSLEKNLNVDSDDNWGLAFYFFEERIRTKYLNPIHVILKMQDYSGEGFAVVNLQCSLIETIECFINGIIYEYPNFILPDNKIFKKGSKGIFKSFFEYRNPFCNLNVDGEDFYKSVRCALLHETQTKKGWKIRTFTHKKSIENKIIYRKNFQNDIEKLIENYKTAIIEGKDFSGNIDTKFRENFKLKFNNICRTSIDNGNI